MVEFNQLSERWYIVEHRDPPIRPQRRKSISSLDIPPKSPKRITSSNLLLRSIHSASIIFDSDLPFNDVQSKHYYQDNITETNSIES